MGTMKLYELVNHYHIGTELTCAEAMFMACNEYYHLNLSEETRKMFSVMGLGMQTEHSCCGAFTVAVGIIGLMTAKEGQKMCIRDSPGGVCRACRRSAETAVKENDLCLKNFMRCTSPRSRKWSL